MPLFRREKIKMLKHKMCKCGSKRAYFIDDGIEACFYLMTNKIKFKVKWKAENSLQPNTLIDENNVDHTGAELMT